MVSLRKRMVWFTLASVGVAGMFAPFADDIQEYALVMSNRAEYEHDLRQAESDFSSRAEMGERIRQRLSLKMLITRDLANNRLRLVDAAEQFRDLNEIEPRLDQHTRHLYPAGSEDQSHALQVLSFVAAYLRNDRAKFRERMTDLNGQFASLCSRRR